MNGRGKSDRPIDTEEASEQRWEGFPAAEDVEGGPDQGESVL